MAEEICDDCGRLMETYGGFIRKTDGAHLCGKCAFGIKEAD